LQVSGRSTFSTFLLTS